MEKLRQFDRGLARGEAILATTILLALIFVAFLQALFRNIADQGVQWANEALEWMSWGDSFMEKATLWVAMLGASLATYHNKHIAIDVLSRVASPKARAIMQGVALLFAGTTCFFFARVVLGSIRQMSGRIANEYGVLDADFNIVHVCEAAPDALETARQERPGFFCAIRTGLESFDITANSPEIVLNLVVPTFFTIMAVRFLFKSFFAFSAVRTGGLREAHGEAVAAENSAQETSPHGKRSGQERSGRRPMTLLLLLAILLLALIGAPLLAIFAAAAMFFFAALPDAPLSGAAADIFSEKFAESPLLVTIPLFTFAGYLMAESGTPRRLVRVSRAWFGWMPGGLAVVLLDDERLLHDLHRRQRNHHRGNRRPTLSGSDQRQLPGAIQLGSGHERWLLGSALSAFAADRALCSGCRESKSRSSSSRAFSPESSPSSHCRFMPRTSASRLKCRGRPLTPRKHSPLFERPSGNCYSRLCLWAA